MDEKRVLPVAFWIVGAIEALGTLALILRLPPDPKHAVLAGFSLQRLALFAASLLLAGFFTGLAWACWKGHPLYRRAASAFNDRLTGWVGLVGLLTALVSGWLFLLPPPALQGALIQRLQPYLLFLIIIVVQGELVFWRLEPKRFISAAGAVVKDLANPAFQAYAGWALLLVSFLIGLLTVYFTYYNLGDEGDTLAVGWMISQGKVLYRDIFSHHFPFSYLWIGLVMRIFGPSILAARVSIVVLRTAVFAWAMKITRWHLPAGITVLAWSLIGPLFLANMLMYDSFGALLLAPAIFVTLAYLLGRSTVTREGLAFVGGMVALAGLSDPTAVVPGLLLLVILLLSAISVGHTGRERVKIGGYRLGTALLSLGGVGLLFLVGFAVTGSLGEFYHQAIWFNQVVYNQYAPLPGAIDLLKGALNGLDILNPYWWKYPGVYYQWLSYLELDQWVFTGFFFRLSVIGLAFYLLIRRKWLAGFSVYLLASTLLWRGATAFHAQAFILFSIVCAALLTGGSLRTNGSPLSEASRPALQRRVTPVHLLSLLILLPLGGMFVWLNLRAVQFWVDNRPQLRYAATFSGFEGNGGYYRQITCHQPDASILIYPGWELDYLAARILPATRYPFMLPWVAQVGQAEAIATLLSKKDSPVLVIVDKNASIWGYPVKTYLRDLIQALDQAYIPINPNVYMSPGLKARCLQQKK